MSAYTDWIVDYRKRLGDAVLGSCRDACAEMRKAFPELSEVRGHVFCRWGKRGHVWLKAPDGSTIDPTANQFPWPLEYQPWSPGDEVLAGKCMHCGDEIWMTVTSLDSGPVRRTFCSESCGDAAASDLAAECRSGRMGLI